MKKVLIISLILFGAAAFAQQKGQVRFGGGLGVSFGSNSFVSVNVSPMLGYFVTDKLETGLAAGYQYTGDDFFKSNLFSVGPYVNYFAFQNLFLSGQYEFYSGSQTNKITDDDFSLNESALWLGGGYQTGGRVNFRAGIMYNVLYDEDDSIFASGVRPFFGVGLML